MPCKKAACAACPATSSSLSFVPFEGPADARILLVGQGPGDVEAALGSPFVGPSGQIIDKWFALAGLDRGQILIGNCVLCWMPKDLFPAPKGNRPPKAAETAYCRENYWGSLVPNRSVIVAVGVPAMKQFFGPRASERSAGAILRHESGAWIVGLLHPAAILRGGWGMEGAQIQALKRVKNLLAGWQPPVYDFDEPPPGANIFPTLREMEEWRAGLGPNEVVSVDAENAGWIMRMVGLTAVDSLKHIAIHFRQQGGKPWVHCPDCGGIDDNCMIEFESSGLLKSLKKLHPMDQFEGVVEFLFDFLRSSQPLIMHNGFHDIEMLEEIGFEVANYYSDTIFLAHMVMPEARKRLEHVACVTSGIAGWKSRLEEGDGHWK